MTIRAATRIAAVGVSCALVMSIVGSFLFDYAYASSRNPTFVRDVQRVYYLIGNGFNYGSLLIFFLTLNSKQKAREKA